MIAWIKAHPLMTGGLVVIIIVLFLVLRKSGGGTVVVGPSDAALNANLAASVQLAALQATAAGHASDLNAAIAGKKIDAATYLALAGAQRDVSLAGIFADSSTQTHNSDNALLATQYSTDAVVQAQRINAGRDVSIVGIQADVAKDTTAKQLAAQTLITKASVDVAGISADVQNTRTKAALAGLIDTNRTSSEINSTNAVVAGKSLDTAVTLAGIDADTQRLAISTSGNLYTDLIDTQGRIASQTITAGADIATHRNNIIQDLLSHGILNKGGEGGLNQVSVLDTWLGNFQGGTTAAAGAASEGVAGSGMWASIIGTIGSTFGAVFGKKA